MIRILRLIGLLSIMVSWWSMTTPTRASTLTTMINWNGKSQYNAPPSADSLERPNIIYHNQRTGYSYTHADIANNDTMRTVSMVYSRQEGTRYKVYYQQRPYLDYDLHPSPAI